MNEKLKPGPDYPDHHDPDMCECDKCKPNTRVEQPCKTCGGTGQPCSGCGEFHSKHVMCPPHEVRFKGVDSINAPCPDCGLRPDCAEQPKEELPGLYDEKKFLEAIEMDLQQPKAGRLTIKHYEEAMRSLEMGKLQLKPDGQNCSICGDIDHQAFECHHNPLVAMAMVHSYRCFHCGNIFDGLGAKEHFGETERDKTACTEQPRAGEFVKRMREKYSKRTGAIGTIGKDDVFELCDIIDRLEQELDYQGKIGSQQFEAQRVEIECLRAQLTAKESCIGLKTRLKWILNECNSDNSDGNKLNRIRKAVEQALKEKP